MIRTIKSFVYCVMMLFIVSIKTYYGLPRIVFRPLKHYFLTYNDLPGLDLHVEITHIFVKEEAHEIIRRSMEDYRQRFENFELMLRDV